MSTQTVTITHAKRKLDAPIDNEATAKKHGSSVEVSVSGGHTQSLSSGPIRKNLAMGEGPGFALEHLEKYKQMTEVEAGVVHDMVLNNEVSGGTPAVLKFEESYRQFTGLKYAVSTFNGTQALYSAMFGLKVGPGDEVICPTYNWIASVAPAIALGASPVFVDIDPETLLIDVQAVRKAITSRTKAIVVVHLWGYVADMDALLTVSRDSGVPIIEDCSHAHGAMYKGKPVGTMGIVGCWSLQGAKPVSGGEGGILATNNVEVYERTVLFGQINRVNGVEMETELAKSLRPLGLGMKTRASPLCMALAECSLRRLPGLNQRRSLFCNAVVHQLQAKGITCLRAIKEYEGAQKGGFYAFPFLFDSKALDPEEKQPRRCSELVLILNKMGVNAANADRYPLLHTHLAFKEGFDVFGRNRGGLCTPAMGGTYQGKHSCPNAEAIWHRILFLPVLSDASPSAEDAAAVLVDIVLRAVQDYKSSVLQKTDTATETKTVSVNAPMTKLSHNVVVVGYGMAGKGFHCYLVNLVGSSLRLYGVHANREQIRKDAKRDYPDIRLFSSIQQICDDQDVDVVVLATPTNTHFTLAQEFLASGKHVVVDKPMCTTVNEATTLIESSAKHRRLLTCFQNRRWDGDFLTVKKLLADGTLGKVRWVEMAYQKGPPNKPWKAVSVHNGGGRLWDLGIHLVDQFLQLFPLRTVTGVYCRMLREFNEMTEVDSHALITVELDDNTTGVIDTNSTIAIEKPRFLVVGDIATYEKHGVDPQEAAIFAPSPNIKNAKEDSSSFGRLVFRDKTKTSVAVPTLSGDWTKYYSNLSDALQGKVTAAVSPESVLRAIAVLQAALTSAKYSQRIAVTI